MIYLTVGQGLAPAEKAFDLKRLSCRRDFMNILESIMDALKFAYRQKAAVYRVGEVLTSIFAGGFHPKRIIAFFIAFFEMFVGIADRGLTPLGQELNLDGYSLVMFDDFDGDTLNTDLWYYRGIGTRRAGYTWSDQVKVENGNLIITAEYLEDGHFGAGWYAGKIGTVKKYNKGYFEIRCKCNDGGEIWSAFWTMPEDGIDPYNHYTSQGGVGGAEMDIFEAPFATEFGGLRNSVSQTIHCNGVDDDVENIDSRCLGFFKGKNIYDEYNTYGLEWTEDEYIFYINGVETARTTYENGTCDVNEEVIVSLELPDEITFDHDYSTQFVVDYVKIWQK